MLLASEDIKQKENEHPRQLYTTSKQQSLRRKLPDHILTWPQQAFLVLFFFYKKKLLDTNFTRQLSIKILLACFVCYFACLGFVFKRAFRIFLISHLKAYGRKPERKEPELRWQLVSQDSNGHRLPRKSGPWVSDGSECVQRYREDLRDSSLAR